MMTMMVFESHIFPRERKTQLWQKKKKLKENEKMTLKRETEKSRQICL